MNPVQFLAFRAAFNRTEVAAVARDKVHTYHAMYNHVRMVAARLRDEGVGPGQTVAVYVGDQYLHFVTALALMHEGVTQVSGDTNYGPLPGQLTIDAYVADRAMPDLARARTIMIGEDWLMAPVTRAQSLAPRQYPNPETPCRIDGSSGTTSDSKAIPISAGKLALRVMADGAVNPPTGPMLTPMGQGVGWGLSQPLVSIYFGQPIIFTSFKTGEDILAMKSHCVSLLVGSVFHAKSFADYLDDRGISMPGLRCVQVGGAGVTPKLLGRIQRLLNPKVVVGYGASECSFIAAASPQLLHNAPEGAAGLPVPDVRIEIVDDNDTPMPTGTEGRVRVHRATAATEYLDDPVATARAFRDGWFYPGDVGYILESGVVVLTGRVDEIINVGGAKINPAKLDEFISDLPGVVDAATFAMDDGGVARVWAAVAPDDDYNEEAVRNQCQAQFGILAPQRYVRVGQIPRNRLGKIVRRELVLRTTSAEE